MELQQQVIQNERLSVVGRMAAQVAHEIRNPLSSIILNLELLDDELDELKGQRVTEIRNLLTTIDTEVNHLNNLTDDYLSFVRMPALNPKNHGTVHSDRGSTLLVASNRDRAADHV